MLVGLESIFKTVMLVQSLLAPSSDRLTWSLKTNPMFGMSFADEYYIKNNKIGFFHIRDKEHRYFGLGKHQSSFFISYDLLTNNNEIMWPSKKDCKGTIFRLIVGVECDTKQRRDKQQQFKLFTERANLYGFAAEALCWSSLMSASLIWSMKNWLASNTLQKLRFSPAIMGAAGVLFSGLWWYHAHSEKARNLSKEHQDSFNWVGLNNTHRFSKSHTLKISITHDLLPSTYDLQSIPAHVSDTGKIIGSYDE